MDRPYWQHYDEDKLPRWDTFKDSKKQSEEIRNKETVSAREEAGSEKNSVENVNFKQIYDFMEKEQRKELAIEDNAPKIRPRWDTDKKSSNVPPTNPVNPPKPNDSSKELIKFLKTNQDYVAFMVAIIVLALVFLYLASVFEQEQSLDEWLEENKSTHISVSMINYDDARHPVHVYLDDEHVYGEWIEAGEMVWPIICPDRCPDGAYTVSVDWGGDGEFECMVRVDISYEGDREAVACNYN